MCKNQEKDHPLDIQVVDGKLIIQIGIERMAFCAKTDDGPMKGCNIEDEHEFASEVACRMSIEVDLGQTQFGEFLDVMMVEAAQQLGIDIPRDKYYETV